jgi:cytochrome c-type biogenesis protein CcmF
MAEVVRRLRTLPRADWGKSVAHAGLGLTIFGIAAITAWEVEDIRVAAVGDRYVVGAYEFRFDDVRSVDGKNYTADQGVFTAFRSGAVEAELRPEKRFYPVQGMPTTEAAINMGLSRDLYVVLGDRQPEGGYAVRIYIKPFSNWIWIGAIVMALGGCLSLTDRRYRIGAARRQTPHAAVAAE